MPRAGRRGAALRQQRGRRHHAAEGIGDLTQALLAGETLEIRKAGDPKAAPITLRGKSEEAEVSSPWLARLIARLPVDAVRTPQLTRRELIATAAGNYEVTLNGNVRSGEQTLGIAATRMAWYVGAMLAAIVLAWLLIELSLLRRVTVLTRRAAAVSYNVNAPNIEQHRRAWTCPTCAGATSWASWPARWRTCCSA